MPTLNAQDIALLIEQGIKNITQNYGYKRDKVFESQLNTLIHAVYSISLEMTSALFVLEQFERRLRNFKKIKQTYFTSLNPIIEIALASIMLGSKYGEELSVWNEDFLEYLPSALTVKQLNQIEKFHFKALRFQAGLPLSKPEKRLSEVFNFFNPLHIKQIEKELQNYKHNEDTSPSVIHKAIFISFKQSIMDRKPNKVLGKKSKDDIDYRPSKHQQMTLTFFEPPIFLESSKEKPESLQGINKLS